MKLTRVVIRLNYVPEKDTISERMPSLIDVLQVEIKKQYSEENIESSNQKKKIYAESRREETKLYNRQYYQENKEYLSQQMKTYHDNHKDAIIERAKRYYVENKSKVQERKRQTTTCECGSVVGKYNVNVHLKSLKPQQYLNKIANEEP